MKIKEYPLLKLLIGFIVGILIAKSFIIPTISLGIPIIFLVILAFLSWPQKYLFPYNYRFLSGIFVYFFFIILGISSFQYHFDNSKSMYFGNDIESAEYFQIRIIEPPLEKKKSIKVFAEIEASSNANNVKEVLGVALVYFQKDSVSSSLEYNDVLIVKNNFSQIEESRNPDQFNYKAFLELKNIRFQSYLRTSDWQKLDIISSRGVKYYALKLRTHLLNILEQNEVKDDELGIAAGMLLGVRDMLSPELRQAYAGAGAMHILCVSGLHVGIILLILNGLLGFMSNRTHSKLIKAAIILGVIWFYAFLTGLSPSVVRAATMFSFVTVGQNISRHTSIYSSLTASAFVLLVFNPGLLFDLGFQLSYSAVVAIVTLQKPLSDLWTPKNIIIFKIWQLITVSIAAQIGTAPLALYYFHQFPNLFLLTNIIVIPAAYIIIILGIFVLLMSFIPFISILLGKLLSLILSFINYLIIGIEGLPFAVAEGVYIDKWMLILIAALIISMSIWLILQKRQLIFVNLTLLILIVFANIFKYDLEDELILYHSKKNTYFAIYSNRNALIICDSVVYKDSDIMNFQTQGHELKKGIVSREYISLDSLVEYRDEHIAFNFPFVKFNNSTISFYEKLFQQKSDINLDYVIIDNMWNTRTDTIYSNTPIVLSANMPKWKRNKFIEKYSMSRNIINVARDGAWVN